MNRKSITKEMRMKVYNKYNHHCAYCGCELDLKEMQIDHLYPIYKGGVDTIENYMPACRMCNFYKSTFGLEDFRKRIFTLNDRLEKIFIYRLAKKYGLIKEENKQIEFYFEKRKQVE